MTASDYPVSFGYRATDGEFYGPNGSVGKYHRGNDHACPVGTPIVIAGVTIGKTGNTGVTGGPHLHIQAGTDQACQKDIDPSPYEFKPGTVVAVNTASQWGRYITLQVGDKYVTYCHLSEQFVNVGQVISDEEVKMNREQLVWNYLLIGGYQPSNDEVNYWMDRISKGATFKDVTEEMKTYFQTRGSGYYQYREGAEKQIADLQDKLKAADANADGAVAAKKLQAIKDALA